MEKINQKKKTRVMAIGDIHGDVRMAEKLAEKAMKMDVDIVILSGDLTFAEQSLKGIIGPFAKIKKDVLIVPGNHEAISTTAFLSEAYAPYSKHLHGYSFKKNDVGFFGAGTANMGPHQIEDSDIYKLLKKSHDEIKSLKSKIMVTHIHPKDTKFEFTGWEGSDAVRKAIKSFQPDIAICSHIHEAAGLEEKIGKTRVINVARKEVIFEV